MVFLSTLILILMLEVNKTHEEFSNVSEEEEKKTEKPEKPENSEKKQSGEENGAITSPDKIISYESLEKMWNQTLLGVELSLVRIFIIVCLSVFGILLVYKITNKFLKIIFDIKNIMWSKCPSDLLKAKQQIVDLKKSLVEAEQQLSKLQRSLVEQGSSEKFPVTTDSVFGALKKKRISLKR